MFNIFINKFKEICPFYRPCQPVLYTVSSRSLMAKRAIFWLFLVELFMEVANCLPLHILLEHKLNSDIATNIYLKSEKLPQSALEIILKTRLNFIEVLLTIIGQKYVNCMFLPSHLENRLNVPLQFLAGAQQDSSKGKENICSTLEHFASRSPSLIKLLQTKSIQANFGVFTHHHLQKKAFIKFKTHHPMQTQSFWIIMISSPFALEFLHL